jgi:uroporphyrin-III C-methyltransferase/precorrin-2 dehydrogenase/sirohydrochlorin ferrochelatase
VFLDLAGKRVIVAGNSSAAAWKAELVAATGADVQVYAPDASEEMLGLLEHGAANGSLAHYRHHWTRDALKDAALAICDAADEAEAQAFAEAAKAVGVACNVIDRPRYGTVQFGAIVNRSPVVVGISTGGAAPILAQAIRQRIETLLPPSLAEWAALARAIRRRVMRRLASRPQRRGFWEGFSALALGAAPDMGSPQAIDRLIAGITVGAGAGNGRVTLVGAGPGDAELLTLKAVRAMHTADVILFDDLVSADVLELARREAKRLLVGLRGREDRCQVEPHDLMVRLARAGKNVVRLESGDLMSSGRTGEEGAWLMAKGIAVEVVPGVATAALGTASHASRATSGRAGVIRQRPSLSEAEAAS